MSEMDAMNNKRVGEGNDCLYTRFGMKKKKCQEEEEKKKRKRPEVARYSSFLLPVRKVKAQKGRMNYQKTMTHNSD
jgi:hypothetical protein